MNRRGFIGALVGLPFIGKITKLFPPTASAIQATCESAYRYEVRFLTRDGREIEPTPVLKVIEMDEATNTIWLDGSISADAVNRIIVMSPARGQFDDIPYFQISGERVRNFIGIDRA